MDLGFAVFQRNKTALFVHVILCGHPSVTCELSLVIYQWPWHRGQEYCALQVSHSQVGMKGLIPS